MSLISFPFFSFRLFARVYRGGCLERVSFFVGVDYPYTFVLFLLFPLVSCSAGVATLLKMSEATSVSTPYKAWTVSCSLIGKDEQRIKDRF